MTRGTALLTLGLVLASAGCTSHTASSFNFPNVQTRASTAPDAVQLLDAPGERSYTVLAKVHAHGRCNWFFGAGGCSDARMRRELQQEAAKLGATAVIGIKQDRFSSFEWSDVHYHGVAIAWQ